MLENMQKKAIQASENRYLQLVQEQGDLTINGQPKLTDYIPIANPIKKREKLQPFSIFPLFQLPKFNYQSDIQQPTILSQSSSNPKEKFILDYTQLRQIFANPSYIYSKRVSMKNNYDFGCLKVQYSESKKQNKVKNVQSIEQYIEKEKKGETSEVLSSQQKSQELQEKICQGEKQRIYFQSKFQSGNLCLAAPVQNSEDAAYYLLCLRDFNTSKCTQWFFFKTINKLSGIVTFHILNFIKDYSVFQSGMKICYASKSNSYKWLRGCTDIKYRETNIPMNKKGDKFYYALSFSFQYQNPEDIVYFSYCYPYTYSMLQEILFHKSETSPYLKRRNIAVTPGGNNVDLITISNFKQKQHKKRIVFITSRVHPGETPSSFICEGMIKFLIGETQEAQALRDNFIFKFVPMLNPDGVINGSYRCSLSGYDLNRVWHRADKISHPQIYGTRKAIFQTNEVQKIFMFADLHAHSKKKGVFAYGCQDKNNPYLCRQLPFLFWRNVVDFNYYQCNFMMRKGRQGTSRLFIYRELDIDYSYTIEHSFCGPLKDKVHYNPKDYVRIGVSYLNTFFKFFCRHKKTINTTQFQIFKDLYMTKDLIKVGEMEQCSSSDEELDKQKAPLEQIQYKSEKKSITKKQCLRMSEGSILSNPKKTVSNFRKTNLMKLNDSKQFFTTRTKQFSSFGDTIRPLPIVGPTFKQRKQQKSEEVVYISFKPRVQSSMTQNPKSQNADKKPTKQMYRYEEQQEINSLTNLFLPSLTRASYKKYNRKSSSPRNSINLTNQYLESAIVLKQQIKSIQRKKLHWKDRARSYL